MFWFLFFLFIVIIYFAYKQDLPKDIKAEKIDVFTFNKREFQELLGKYKNKVESLKDKPDEAEKYVKRFIQQMGLGSKLYDFLGRLEEAHDRDINWGHKSILLYKSVNKNQLKGKRGGIFSFSNNDFKIEFGEEHDSTFYEFDEDTYHKSRDLKVIVNKKVVAEFFERQSWGAHHSTCWYISNPYCHLFKPGDWVYDFFQLYKEWESEFLKLKKEYENKKEIEKVKNIEDRFL